MNLEKLFNPGSIAVVGATPLDGKVGNVIMKNLFAFGYKGKIFLVNPKYDDIFSQKCYKSLDEITEEIDLAIMAIPAELAVNEIEKNAERIKNFVVISAGFSETDGIGKERERRLSQIAEEKKINILGPNCLGFIIPSIKLNASFAGGMPRSGSVSFISQSGALAVALLDIAEKENTGFSSIISIGNKMSLSETEILEYLAKDEKTKVIGMYLEGIKDGEKFKAAAQKVSLEKPIIILKAGKNAKTQKAIASHTGALAGDDDIVSAVFRKTGVLRANNLQDFFDLFNLIGSAESAPGDETIVITNAGGVGVLTADAFSGKSIRLADICEETKKKLREFLPVESSVENPIDLLGDAREDRYAKTLEIIAAIPDVGSIICVLTPQDQTPVEKIAEEIIRIKKKTGKLMVTVFLGGTRVEKAVDMLRENGICNFNFPDDAVGAINGYFRWNEFRKLKTKEETQIVNAKRKEKVSLIIEKAKKEGRSALYFSESAKIMEMYGVSTVGYEEIAPKNISGFKKLVSKFPKPRVQKSVKFPVVLKVDSDQVLHKTDRGGLILNIKDAKKLKAAIAEMRESFPAERLIIQSMTEKGAEIIIGIKRDKIFGPIVLYGLGGIYTEFLHQVDYLVSPLNLAQIEEALLSGKLGFLFQGARSQKKYNCEELARVLLGIIFLSLEVPEIKEFDINPLFIYNDGRVSQAVDVKIIV